LLAFEQDLEPRLGAGRGDLAHLAGWAAKLAGATCRLAGLLHLAGDLRDGWNRPISADTFAGAVLLADYLVEHARAVFDLMGADTRLDDARWLLEWISRTNQVQFSRRDAHQATRGRFRKATDLEPALRLLEEHGYLRRVDPEPPRDPHGRGRPASPRFLVNPLPRATETTQTTKTPAPELFLWILWFLWRVVGVPNEGRSTGGDRGRRGEWRRFSHALPAVTLSNENGPSRSWPSPYLSPAACGRHKATMLAHEGNPAQLRPVTAGQ
jgi:Protein of unknown function (DUF3987)